MHRRLALVWFCWMAATALASSPVKERRGMLKVAMWLEPRLEATPVLQPKDLKVTLQGSPAKVVSICHPGEDLMVLVVFDLTQLLDLSDATKQALVDRIPALSARTYLALLRSQDGLKVLVDPTTDRGAASEAIRTLPISGKAGLLETVETAESLGDAILAKAAIRVAVFYVTDSEVSNYREDFTNPVINYSDAHDLSRRYPEQLIQEKIARMEGNMAGRQAPLFIVHLKYRGDQVNEAYQNGLKRLAEITGGTAVFCRSIAEIPDALQKTWDTIEAHYSVSLELPQLPAKSVEVQLGLNGSAGGGAKSLNYRTRFVFR